MFEKLQKMIEFLAQYPPWVVVASAILLLAATSLLIFFKPRDALSQDTLKDEVANVGETPSLAGVPKGQTSQQINVFNFQNSQGDTFHFEALVIEAEQSTLPGGQTPRPWVDFLRSLPEGDDPWCLDFDGIDDYLHADCPQFEEIGSFRISLSIYPRGGAVHLTEVLAAFENPEEELLLAVLLKPYGSDVSFSRIYVFERGPAETRSFEGPVVPRDSWTDITVESGSSGLRIVASRDVYSYPEAPSLSGLYLCHVGASRDEKKGLYGSFDGKMSFVVVQNYAGDFFALWDFRISSEQDFFVDIRDGSPFGSTLSSKTASWQPSHHPETM